MTCSVFLVWYALSAVFVVSIGPTPRVPRAGDYGYTRYLLRVGQGTISVGEQSWRDSDTLVSIEPMAPAWTLWTNMRARRGCRGHWRWHHGTAAIPLWPLALVALALLCRRSGWIAVAADPSRCARCGYPLDGVTIGRCPECGEPNTAPSP